MSEPRTKSARNRKIEPLSWQTAAQSPALKGMTSFLDISPEDVRDNNFKRFGPRVVAEAEKGTENPPCPGDETYPAVVKPPLNISQPHGPQKTLKLNNVPRSSILVKRIPGLLSASEAVNRPEYVLTPGDETSTECETSTPFVSSKLAHDESLIPGRGRSKIKRCVLAQDGHSLGEEAIYQAMWRTGRPESSDPNGSRSIRIGAAEIGYKVNMAKKNVRQNISRLFEKLALEILEDFETMNSQARLYRIFSYKQILERRRAVGMEFVLRNKGVVFCSATGAEMLSSPAYVSSPGNVTTIRPAPPKKRRVSSASEPLHYPEKVSAALVSTPTDDADLDMVSQALNRYWSVDHGAAVQLLRDCRRIRPDARADEICFFVKEKQELARMSRTITNPTGLVLATVPQCFIGSTFEEFRSRVERRAKLVVEESQRQEKQRNDLIEWLRKERQAQESIVNDPISSDLQRDAAVTRLRNLSTWNP